MEPRATADVADEYGRLAQVCVAEFLQYGGVTEFAGLIATVKCDGDLLLVRQQALSAGEGRVLVVDANASRHAAIAGDGIAGQALSSGWAGLVIWGCVRDVGPLREVAIGVSALGSAPRAGTALGGGEVDVPIEFAGVRFTPGSYVFSDLDGIVVVEQLSH